MSPTRPVLQPRRRFFRPPAAPYQPPDSAAILQAAQQLSKVAKKATDGSKVRKNKKSSPIIIVGPFPWQMLDLSSSSGSSAGSSVRRRDSDGGMLSPPTTPTRSGGLVDPLVDSPTASTDWVAYSTPLEGDDDVILSADASFSSDGSSGRSAPVVYGPAERAVITPNDGKPLLPRDPARDAAFTRMLLQQLEIRGPPKPAMFCSPPRFLEYNAPAPKKPTPNRIIPLPFDPASLRSTSNRTNRTEPPSSRTLGSSSARTVGSFDFDSTRTLVPDDMDSNPHRPVTRVFEEADLFSDSRVACSACDGREHRMFELKPCGDLVCPTCFSSSIAAVSVTQGASKCPACLERVASFEPYKPGHNVTVRGPCRKKLPEPVLDKSEPEGQTVVMRIDNVAWDIEPSLVEKFLPPGTLPVGHPQPIHICIDRRDGRTKDFMYIEVASQAAAQRVLQTRQNSFMPGGRVTGGRKRAVTITQVTHKELLTAIRPNSKAELDSLLELCEAALSTPTPQLHMDASGRGRLHASVGVNGKVHYLKYRHAPFHVLISLMSKMNGPQSPVYWDLFRIASGAISALASSLKHTRHDIHGDRALLAQLNRMFDQYFSTRPRA